MSSNVRLIVGVTLLVIGLILPVGVYPVAQASWPAAVKTAVGGVLFFGFEIMAIPGRGRHGQGKFRPHRGHGKRLDRQTEAFTGGG